MEVKIYVKDMTCHNYSKILRSTIDSLSGVSGVVIKKSQKNIFVSFGNNIVTLNQITKAIVPKGYTPELIHAKKEPIV